MGKKLIDNGMWESSRMILPEHAARVREHERSVLAKVKPVPHSDERDDVYRKISESYELKTEITLVLFDPYEDTRVIGVVERIDPIGQRVRVRDVEGVAEWFRVADVVGTD